MKVRQLRLRLRNAHGVEFDARKIPIVKDVLPADGDILARYILYREGKIPKFYPFRIKLNGDGSRVFRAYIRESGHGVYYVWIERGFVICEIDLDIKEEDEDGKGNEDIGSIQRDGSQA